MSLCSESGSIEENIWGIAQFGCGMLTEVPTFYWENLVKQSVLVLNLLMMQPSEYGIQEVVKIFMVLEDCGWYPGNDPRLFSSHYHVCVAIAIEIVDDLPDAEDADDDAEDVGLGVGRYTCSPIDARLVVIGGGDDKGFIWKISDGDWAFELGGHKDSVFSLDFSMDGQLLASGSFDGLVKIWDASSGDLKCTLEGPGGGIEWVRWHPRGHVVLAGSEDCTVWMWNADRGAYLNMFSGHASSVTCGDFTPDGQTICTGSDDATLRIWNPSSGENIHVVRGHPYHTEGLTCLAITSDSTLALTGSKDSSVHLVNITTGKVVSSLTSHTDSIECIGLHFHPSRVQNALCFHLALAVGLFPTSKHSTSLCSSFLSRLAVISSPWAATGSMDNKLIVWDLQHSSPRCTCDNEDGVTSLSWLGASKYIAAGCVDGKVRIWDSLSGDCVRILSGHSDAIQSLAVSADRNFLFSVSLDGTARVFEIPDFQ
ncbi:angio-associated migratory cell protein-like [Vitis riparia]|uniref:angio-associated migratory cell protein-like n=1 Tax=Vitis riparia TaxID=96939 RepID=UPI00155AC129|nr:angio-associated migratory cell protein-like [Vitis riparia]